MDDFQDKTHDATQHRRDKAAEEGQVPRSQDLTAAILLLAGMLMMLYFGQSIADFLGEEMRSHLTTAWTRFERHDATSHVYELSAKFGWALLPLLGLLVVLAVGVNLGQVGFLFLPDKVAFDPSHLDPVAGFERVFSLNNAVRLGFGMFKVAVAMVVAGWCLWNEQESLAALPTLSLTQVASYLFTTCMSVGIKVTASLLVLAVIDYLYQWWKNEEDLRMTTQEIREEMKQMQGDPQTIARRRQIMRQMAMGNVGRSVPTADVVVTNPTELAIALKYDMEKMAAPVVVAKGAGAVAQQIRRLALESNIPIVERKELARVLYKEVEINQPVPVEQYAAVAEVLKYVYELKGIKPLAGRKVAA